MSRINTEYRAKLQNAQTSLIKRNVDLAIFKEEQKNLATISKKS